MDKQVILDDKSFKALAAESRVNILKKLTTRRMTLSELSTRLSLRNSTIKEHCNLLLDADLVKKIDEGHKWKYYELTNKGKEIILPSQKSDVKVLITLSISAIIFASIVLFAMQGLVQTSSFTPPTILSGNSMKTLEISEAMDAVQVERSNIQVDQSITITGVNYNLFTISIVIALLIGIFAGWSVKRQIN
jgi:DNA-binding transcriptional ArsR family regulator